MGGPFYKNTPIFTPPGTSGEPVGPSGRVGSKSCIKQKGRQTDTHFETPLIPKGIFFLILFYENFEPAKNSMKNENLEHQKK